MSFTKKDFINFWGDGYLETFDGYNFTHEQIYEKAIKPFESKEKICLEIGCGGGFWINTYLKKCFKEVIGIDVIPKSINIDCKYFELNNQDYSCTPIEDNSIDFVWCFGVFCHLPNSTVKEYVKNIMRILKHSGEAVLMFPNWNNHNRLKNIEDRENFKEDVYSELDWYYINYKEILKNIKYKELYPEFRDALIYIKKENKR